MTTSVETTQHHIPENLPTHLQHFIDGKFVDSIGGKTFDVQEPVSNENYATVASAQPEDVDLAVAAAKRAFKEGPWSKMLPRERSRVLHPCSHPWAQRSRVWQALPVTVQATPW